MLRVHDFSAEQARYIVDRLMDRGILTEFESNSGKDYLDIDLEHETTKYVINEGQKGRLVQF